MSNPFCLNKIFLVTAASFSVAVIFLSSFLVVSASAGFFSWVDESGKTHFTDDISKIPEKYINEKQLNEHEDEIRRSPVASEPPSEQDEEISFEVAVIPSPSGNYFVDVVLNENVKARLMLDTGASVITLSDKIGKKLGLWNGGTGPEIPFSTAGGVVWMPLTILEEIHVGDAKTALVEASINDQMGEIDGLLGMSFLGDFRVNLDRNKSIMTLKPMAKPGDTLWDEKPGLWWRERFISYTKKIRSSEYGMKKLENEGEYIEARKVRGYHNFYVELRNKLNIRANQFLVPHKFRR